MTQLIVIERKAEATVEGGCCEPDYGPEACAPAATDCGPEACASAATGETGEQGVAQAGCCEPDCGPETCTCG